MTGFFSRSGPIETDRSIRASVDEVFPDDTRRIDDGTLEARSHVVRCPFAIHDLDDTAVATAHAATHHLLEGHLGAPVVEPRQTRHRAQHRAWTARVDRQRGFGRM